MAEAKVAKDPQTQEAEEIKFLLDNIPSNDFILRTVRVNSLGMQFKRSLEYVQGGTNMTLDRMLIAFDRVLVDVFTEGFKTGLLSAIRQSDDDK